MHVTYEKGKNVSPRPNCAMADTCSSAQSDMQASNDREQEAVDEEDDPFERRIDDSGCAKYHFALQVNFSPKQGVSSKVSFVVCEGAINGPNFPPFRSTTGNLQQICSKS